MCAVRVRRSAAEPERTVKKLRLARALTLPEATPVSEACRRMAAKRVDAALLTDANGMLSGILTAEVRVRDESGRWKGVVRGTCTVAGKERGPKMCGQMYRKYSIFG